MLKIEVRIGAIDMYGFLGRDLHPKKTDGNQTAELVSVHQERFAEEPTDNVDYVVVRLRDGRMVELMEHEILGIVGAACQDEEKGA